MRFAHLFYMPTINCNTVFPIVDEYRGFFKNIAYFPLDMGETSIIRAGYMIKFNETSLSGTNRRSDTIAMNAEFLGNN